MAAPNIEGTNNPSVLTAGNLNAAGTIVANHKNETLGFYGVTGVAQVASASVTDYASLKVALQALGLIGA